MLNQTYRKRIRIVLPVLLLLFILLLLGSLFLKSTVSMQSTHHRNGYKTVETGTWQERADAEAPIGVRKEYRFVWEPERAAESSLIFYTVHQYVRVYLEGKEVYHLLPGQKNPRIKTVGSNWNIIPLSQEDAGKEIKIEITPVYRSVYKRSVTFLIGSPLAVFMERFYLDLPQLALAMMTLLTGVVTMMVAGYSQMTKRRGKGLVFLGLFSVMLGIWKLTDTRFTPFLFSDYPVQVSMVTMLMLMFGLIPLLGWLKEYVSETSEKILNGLCAFTAIQGGAQIVLQFLGIADFRQMLLISHATLLIGGGDCSLESDLR